MSLGAVAPGHNQHHARLFPPPRTELSPALASLGRHMDTQRAIHDASFGLRIAVAGAVLAAALGLEAGAALRPVPQERSAPPPPQLMIVNDPELVALEDAGAGWPNRHPG